MIDTYLLEYLLAFYEEGSLLKASEKLHISQPSLTRAMQKLELELNLKIFDRNINKIQLNNNGLILIDYVRDILALNNLLEEKAKELKRKELLINIGITAPGIMYYYPNFFFNNREKYSYKTIDQNTCIKEIKEGLIDVAFINKYYKEEGIGCEKIMDEKLYVCLPKEHFLAHKESVTFKELDGQSFLLANDLGVWDDVVKRKLSNSKFFKLDKENLDEVAKYSSIPNFQTNISAKFDNLTDKVSIPVIDDESTLSFYCIYRLNKKNIFDLIKLTR